MEVRGQWAVPRGNINILEGRSALVTAQSLSNPSQSQHAGFSGAIPQAPSINTKDSASGQQDSTFSYRPFQ